MDPSERKPTPELPDFARQLVEEALNYTAGRNHGDLGQSSRSVAISVFHSLLERGYKILPPSLTVSATQLEADLLSEITSAGQDLTRLRQIWRARDPQNWHDIPGAFIALGSSFLECGEPLMAFDVLRQAVEISGTYEAKHLCALALLRAGAVDSARTILNELLLKNPADEEVLGLLAGTEKKLALSASSPIVRRKHFARAFELYRNAFQLTNGYWTGINAASLALVLKKKRTAALLAAKVIEYCQLELQRPGRVPFWVFATLGEAHLIQGEFEAAEKYYKLSIESAGRKQGHIVSMRRNADLVLQEIGRDDFPLNELFPVPDVLVFSGHMLDVIRPKGGLARKNLPEIQRRIESALGSFPVIGYSSAACGSDILFLETNARNGGENYIVLPFPAEDFVAMSVAFAGKDWERRFHVVLDTAADVYVLSSGQSHVVETQFEYANLIGLGLARLKAQQLDSRLRGLAVWDGHPGGVGGTASAVELWKKHHVPVELLQPSFFSAASQTTSADTSLAARQFIPEVRAILFADVVGFSRLIEAQVPEFFSRFMKEIGDFLAHPLRRPMVINTWGDALYLVFENVQKAGRVALELQRRILDTSWSQFGLPPGLALRIGLHGGLVYSCVDPVTKAHTFVGAQVTRAARLEPIAPPGQVYVSQEFAAIAAAEGVKEFSCEYVGITPSAKGYGDYPTYVLRSRMRNLPSQ
jgi:class 3 adenylate cyclase/tetratricopeptide (TPR) repeat protein